MLEQLVTLPKSPGQANHRTHVRHHQVGTGLSPALPAWPEESHGRMDVGLPRVKLETHGCIASAVAKSGSYHAISARNQRIPALKTQFI